MAARETRSEIVIVLLRLPVAPRAAADNCDAPPRKNCAAMSDAIDEYERELADHMAAAEQKAEQCERATTAGERRAAAADAERALEAAKDTVQLIELEARSVPGAARSRVTAKVRELRSQLGDVSRRLKQARAQAAAAQSDQIREDLFAGCHHDRGFDDAGERARILANNERIASGTGKLKNAHDVTMDMEGTAASILGELGKQRETLLHAKGSLSGASEGLEQSRRVLRSMGRRAMANKLVLWVVIALIGALILVVLYTEVVPSSGAPPAAAAAAPKLTDDANEWRVVKGK